MPTVSVIARERSSPLNAFTPRQAFDRRRDRDRRCDHPIGHERCGAEDRGQIDPLAYRRTSAYSEKMPPSPRLSARRVSRTYLKVVCNVSVQNTQLIPPKTSCSVISRRRRSISSRKAARSRYHRKMMPSVTSTPAADMRMGSMIVWAVGIHVLWGRKCQHECGTIFFGTVSKSPRPWPA
jgi:hypothetical protein